MLVSRPLIPGLRPAAVALVAVAAAGGCQSMTKLKDNTYKSVRSLITSSYIDPEAEAKMARAEQLFGANEFAAAQPIFGDLADNTYNPQLLAEKARYYEAECLRERKRLPDAVATYNRLLQDFPSGAFRERACDRMYAIAYGWLESDTLAAIEAEQAGKAPPWWQRGPHMPNVFDKSLPLLDVEGEALNALEHVQTHDVVGPNADKALFWLGYVHFYRGRFEESDQYFSSLVDTYKDSKLRPTALRMAIMAKNNSTGGAVYDSTKASEALQLVHHAEATIPEYTADEKEAAWLTRQKLAVRMQLAEKDFKTAQFYERTNHPASAYFCYTLVCRRYPGTKYSDLSKARLIELDKVRKKMEADRAAGRNTGVFGAAQREWDRLIGGPADDEEGPKDPDPNKSIPTGPQPLPKNLPTDLSQQAPR